MVGIHCLGFRLTTQQGLKWAWQWGEELYLCVFAEGTWKPGSEHTKHTALQRRHPWALRARVGLLALHPPISSKNGKLNSITLMKSPLSFNCRDCSWSLHEAERKMAQSRGHLCSTGQSRGEPPGDTFRSQGQLRWKIWDQTWIKLDQNSSHSLDRRILGCPYWTKAAR